MKLSCPACGAEDVFDADFETILDDPIPCPKCGVRCQAEYDDSINDEGEEIGGFWMEEAK